MGGAELAESSAGELSAGEAGADRTGFGGEVFANRGTAGCVAVVDISNSLMTDVGSTAGDIAQSRLPLGIKLLIARFFRRAVNIPSLSP